MLEWVAISYSRGSSQSKDRICFPGISCIGRHIPYHHATWEAPIHIAYIFLIILEKGGVTIFHVLIAGLLFCMFNYHTLGEDDFYFTYSLVPYTL